MPKVRFLGRVHPDAHLLDISQVPRVNWNSASMGFAVSYDVSIAKNVVTIDCETSTTITNEILGEIAMRGYDVARALIDLAAFALGEGYTFSLEKVIDDAGTESLFFATTAYRPLSTAVAGEEFAKVVPLVLTEPPLFFALRDLITAISEYHRSAAMCARTIDTLRAIFVPPGGSREDGWAQLRENLNLARSYIQPIMDVSRSSRHGDHTHIPGTITTYVTTRTWIIMNRFLEYRKRSNQKLLESEFPILT
jgi:hypothetical protein